ncbi:MAG TPA: IS110 family transposase [Actinobacteria bacterium]|jgi:transposase|nr:IS110 family transposase [Chloroflexota bacterium]HBW20643.1 IS110 family transposase [Actinomycetota bacterium]
MRSIGLDVHTRFAEVAISGPGGKVRPGQRVAATPAELRAFAETLGPDDQVVLEATVNTWPIADLLRAHAGRVVVSNPMRTRAIAEAKVKTDKVDAAVLAQLLAADFIPEVWAPDPATRVLRRQVAHHASLVSQRTALRNRIHGILHRNLVEAPGTDIFGKAGRRYLEQAPLPGDELDQVRSALRLMDALELEVQAVEQRLASLALEDDRVRRLMTIPGVGVTTAVALIAVIGDVTRFPRPQQLVGYLGLDPKVRQSGGRPAYTGHISRQGQAHARGLLVEAAWAATRSPGPLRAFYERLRARKARTVALVAVARKLTVLAWHLLSKQTDYHWTQPRLLADKMRRLELQAGYPRLPRGTRTRSALTHAVQRDQERRLLAQAEEAYRTLVAARQLKRDAVATKGGAS